MPEYFIWFEMLYILKSLFVAESFKLPSLLTSFFFKNVSELSRPGSTIAVKPKSNIVQNITPVLRD